jgi:hypothetical protein
MAENSQTEAGTSQSPFADFIPPLWPLPSVQFFIFASASKGYEFGWTSDGFKISRSSLMGKRTVGSFPLTERGWQDAWRFMASETPQLAGAVRHQVHLTKSAHHSQVVENKARAELASLGILTSLRGCAFLGGYGHSESLMAGAVCDLHFTSEGLLVTNPDTSISIVRSPYAEAEIVELSGPGRVTRGGGFIGGGFGLTGAAEGMIVASVLNALTTKTSIQTIIRWEARTQELFFFTSEATPSDLRIRMSPVLGRVKPRPNVEATPSLLDADVVSQLERLASLRQQGIIDDNEFAELKRKIISG